MELSKKTDYQLIKIIKEKNSNDAYIELKKRNEKCYYRTCESYCKRVPSLKYSELIEDVDFVLDKSIKSFNSKKKSKFSSWATNMSRYHILNTIKKLNEIGSFVPIEDLDLDLLNNKNNKYHLDTNEDFKNHVFTVIDTIKDKRAKKIFELRFYSDREGSKWKNIAKDMNLSVQQTMNIFNSTKNIIYKNLVSEEIENN
jgi:RNA polymerase sigma factor (sigma-70 family)